jgi:hypothetical protein
VASAYERQWHAGVGLGYSYLGAETPVHGIATELHLSYGLNDMFNLMAEADAAYHFGDGKVLALSGSAGVGYVIDILQVVPYVGVMVGGYDLFTTDGPCGGADQPACHAGRLGVSIPAGFDYTVTRSFNVGAAVRYHLLLLGPNPVESMVTAFVRAEYVWGY